MRGCWLLHTYCGRNQLNTCSCWCIFSCCFHLVITVQFRIFWIRISLVECITSALKWVNIVSHFANRVQHFRESAFLLKLNFLSPDLFIVCNLRINSFEHLEHNRTYVSWGKKGVKILWYLLIKHLKWHLNKCNANPNVGWKWTWSRTWFSSSFYFPFVTTGEQH